MNILEKFLSIKEFFTYYNLGKKQFTRQEIEKRQQSLLPEFFNNLKKSPYYKKFNAKEIKDFPIVDKKTMNENFNNINTKGLDFTVCQNLNKNAEISRNFSNEIHGISIGSSSGTSGKPSVFAISQVEKARWAGFILGKSINIFKRHKIALFLRANNNLYSQLNAGWISFNFFDLQCDIKSQIKYLQIYQPTVLVAPAQVLKAIALYQKDGLIDLQCKKIYNAAEVLDSTTKLFLESVFKQPIQEIYQATEGFLGITCEYNQMHLNEENLYIEKQWLDENRFIPIVTDLLRTTQPIVRYRLDDILVEKKEGCLCHRGSMVLERIEGRLGDSLKFYDINKELKIVFSDMLLKIITSCISYEEEFNLIQTGKNKLTLHINNCKKAPIIIERISHYLQELKIEDITWETKGYCPSMSDKRRKISCQCYE